MEYNKGKHERDTKDEGEERRREGVDLERLLPGGLV